jgi:predicted permease
MEGSVRERELTVRTALGAPRGALVRLHAVEAALVGLIGGLAGALLGAWGLTILRTVLPPSLPRVSDVRVDAVLIGAGVMLAVVATLAFGLLPAARASRRDAAAALRNRESPGNGSRLRDVLVAGEVALTLVLLFGAALLGRSLWAAAHTPMGFDADTVVTVDLSLPGARYGDTAAHARFYAAVIERLASVPGVDSAGVTGALPLTPTAATTMVAQDGPDDQQPVADVVTASPGFFTAFRLRLVRGRMFSADDRPGAPPVAVINETAARTMWPAGADPIGRTLEMRDWGPPYRATVVGVVADVKQAGADRATRAAVYYPLVQFPQTTLTQTIVVRSNAAVSDTVASVRAAVRGIDPQQPLGVTAPMRERMSAALAPRRFDLILLGAFGMAALLLAAVGVYGIVAFAMAARAREIGIRIALGAAPIVIVRLAAGKGATPIAAGIAAGAAASWLGATAVGSLLYGVAPRDAISLLTAAALIGATGIAAIAGPAIKALRIDPAISFRWP